MKRQASSKGKYMLLLKIATFCMLPALVVANFSDYFQAWQIPQRNAQYHDAKVFVLPSPDSWLPSEKVPLKPGGSFLARETLIPFPKSDEKEVMANFLMGNGKMADTGKAGCDEEMNGNVIAPPDDTQDIKWFVHGASKSSVSPFVWTNDADRGTLLEAGDAVLTCGVFNASDAVVGLFEVRTPQLSSNSYALTGSGQYPIWNRPEELHPADWSFTNLGSVFGSTVDRDRNIFVTATSTQVPQATVTGPNGITLTTINYQSNIGTLGLNGQPLTGATATQASGTIYKLDAITGTPTVFAQLPQQQITINYQTSFFSTTFNLTAGLRTLGPGLGNIAYDDRYRQFFVTNFEDGKIYRIDEDGTIEANPFDFGTPDNGAAGMPPLGDRVYGVAVYDNRVYYSVWTDIICPNGNCGNASINPYQAANGIPPTIRSVALDPGTGDFLPATDQLEWTGTDLTWTSPISDIDFNVDGDMIIAQQTIMRDFSAYNHRSEVAILTGGSGSWTAEVIKTGAAVIPPGANRYGTEAYGGADFGYNGLTTDASIWFTSADMVNDNNLANGSQGPHGFAGALLTDLNGVAAGFPDPRAIIPYLPSQTSPVSNDTKGQGGEIDIVNECMSLGNLVWEDSNDNGMFDAGEPTLENVRVRLLSADGLTVIDSTLTNGDGNYLFASLFAGDYIVEIVPPAGYMSSTGSGFAANTGTFEPAPDVDADATNSDDNGTMTGSIIRSEVVSLRENTELLEDGALAGLTDATANKDNNYSVDFGLIVLPPECSLSITTILPTCTFGSTTGESTFAVTVNVAWDYADLATTSELINVTFADQTLTIDPASTAVGTGMVEFAGVTGPAYDQLVTAAFATTPSCSATGVVDLIACTPDCVDGVGTVGGNVFNDFNNDGADAGAGEVGQENALVEVYDCDGVLVCSTYTNADGNWSCDGLTDGEEYRVEFSTPLQPYLQPSFAGTDNGTNTQFTTAPSCAVDYGVVDPADFCEMNPLVITNCYINGDAATQGGGDVIVDFTYDGNGLRQVGSGAQVGATWGLAYDQTTKKVFVSEVLRRHSGTGSGGLGGIYTIDYSGTTPAAPVLFTTVPDVGSVTRDFTFIGNAADRRTTDGAAFAAAGRAGIGDVDISSDGTELYVTNLGQSRVDVLDPVTGAVLRSITFPELGGCTLRPWALKVAEGELYAGAVCEDALRAYVFRAVGNTFTVVDLNTANATEDYFDLSYQRESVWSLNPTFFGSNECNANQLVPIATQWNAWISNWPASICGNPFGSGEDYVVYPQAILADIEFDDDGSIILGFLDRMGLQGGFTEPDPDGNGIFVTISGGDVLRVCATTDGFAPEGTTGCTYNDNGDDAGYSPGGGGVNSGLDDGSEFYNGDDWLNGSGDGEHYEISTGGLAVRPGSGELILSVYDPINGAFNAGGVRWLSNATGENIRGLQLYGNGELGTFAKATGIGDLELICDPLPIQIGNYVWYDTDMDGVQDACEEPAEGLPVTLYTKDDNGDLTQVATTTTSATGEYYFTGDGTTGETWTNTGEAIIRDTSYVIVFGDQSGETITIAGESYSLTDALVGEGTSPTLNDSDGVLFDLNGNMVPAICYNTADTTDHTLDVGLVPLAAFDLALRKTINTTVNPGPYQPGDAVTFTVKVFNQGDIDATDIEVTDYVPTGLTFTSVAAGALTTDNGNAATVTDNGSGVYTIDALVAGDSLAVDLVLTIDADFMGDELVNYAEITGFDDDNDPTTAPPTDEDSTPGDNQGQDETGTDDNVDDDGPGGNGTPDDPADNDDYDPAVLPVVQSFDLALVKRIDLNTTPGPFTYGSEVTFIIEVKNQGSLDATGVEVADYVPDGMSLVASAAWTMDVDTARLTTPFDLAAGMTEELSITFTIDLDFAGTSIDNVAEISAATNALGLPDEDSTPGDNGEDDPEFDTDDEENDDGPNGNGTPDNPDDSDDFDLARLSLETVSLGSTVFLDNNNDGLQNGADTGIVGVEIQLFDAATMMQVLTDANGARVADPADAAVVLTDSDGDYLFDNLVQGDYYVVLPTAPATAPLSSNNTGIAFLETDPDDNQDNDDEGLQTGGSGTSVSSGTITLSLGEEPENGTVDGTETAQGNMQDDLFDSNGNMTVDFGFFAPVTVGDTTFVDLDGDGLQGPDDEPLGNVTVTVYDNATGMPVTLDAGGMAYTPMQTTAADGSYLFENLPPGDYYVAFDLSTADNGIFYDYTTPNAGDDADDSDAVPAAPEDDVANSGPTGFLTSGSSDLSLDAGVQCAITVMVADPFTICSTQPIDLTQNVSISPNNPSFGGSWTSSGNGTFLNLVGGELSDDPGPITFGEAVTYLPGSEDISNGFVILTLTTDDPDGPCEPVSASVRVEILKVDCGQFPWNGE